eukprot:TRINITY_DN779825_c0_g1_i1.p1 TRINITY_DN779825_c0_g1~~TRINITY_DN779825_c0_g1_i1.p1  ORF type:complete len:253 (-),score=53.74 TRINITY_DN779825_c0_g1_i1:215-973(-)
MSSISMKRTTSYGAGDSGRRKKSKLDVIKVGTVCQCNMNRSMAAHLSLLENPRLNVTSFGAGRHVKLPSPNGPVVQNFGTSYEVIKKEMIAKDPQSVEWWKEKGMLEMLDRNSKIKDAPQRWQQCSDLPDVVICYEKRVFELVLSDLELRPLLKRTRPMHIFNIETKDDGESALKSATLSSELCKCIIHHNDKVQSQPQPSNILTNPSKVPLTKLTNVALPANIIRTFKKIPEVKKYMEDTKLQMEYSVYYP